MNQAERIASRRRARRQHAIVGRVLLLDAQLPRGEPRTGMKPVERAGERGGRPAEAVAAGDMRQLVEQDEAPPLGGPSASAGSSTLGASVPQVIGMTGPWAMRSSTRRDSRISRDTRDIRPCQAASRAGSASRHSRDSMRRKTAMRSSSNTAPLA